VPPQTQIQQQGQAWGTGNFGAAQAREAAPFAQLARPAPTTLHPAHGGQSLGT